MTDKMDKWKLVSIVLIVIIAVLLVIGLIHNSKTYPIGKLRLAKSTLDDLSSNFAPDFIICKTGTKECLRFGNMDS
jgi:hypothetical protein